MRFRYSAQASSAQAGSLALTARTWSRGTPGFLLGRNLPETHGLAPPHLFQVVELAHRGMHDVHHHVAEVDQHPFAARLALDAVDARAVLPDLVLHAVGQRLHLARRVAARDHHALEHRGHARGVVDLDIAPLDVLEGVDHHALLLADIHQE